MTTSLSIAIVSDLHAHTLPPTDAKAPSHLSLHSDQNQPTSNPIAGLLTLVKEHGLTADALLCAGDMGDKADHAAQSYVWDKLQAIGAHLGAKNVLATAGNHDLDSRFGTEFDAKGILQSLSPPFPGLNEAQCDRYWSRNFVVHDEETWRIVLLNSAAYHGARAPVGDEHAGSEEYERGRVSVRTVNALKAALQAAPPRALNILLCHHHPVKNSEIPPSADYSEMVDGDILIRALTEMEVGGWTIIHGHKHFPRIGYAGADSGDGPVIISAGSFSARLYPEISSVARNQFYIARFPLDEIATHKVGVLGEIHAWDWIPSLGWQPAQQGSGIPHRAGFGWRDNSEKVASEIATAVKTLGGDEAFVKWTSLTAALPLLNYLTPSSMRKVTSALKSAHALSVLSEDDGVPMHVGGAR